MTPKSKSQISIKTPFHHGAAMLIVTIFIIWPTKKLQSKNQKLRTRLISKEVSKPWKNWSWTTRKKSRKWSRSSTFKMLMLTKWLPTGNQAPRSSLNLPLPTKIQLIRLLKHLACKTSTALIQTATWTGKLVKQSSTSSLLRTKVSSKLQLNSCRPDLFISKSVLNK